MSDTQDFATFPVVATQVKLGGWSRQGGGSVSLRPRPHQELQAFLSLLGEFPGVGVRGGGGGVLGGLGGPSVSQCERWDLPRAGI